MRVGAVENSEDKRGTASQARHLRAQLPAKRKAEKKEGKAPLFNRAGRQGADRLLRPSAARGNQSAERKKARKNHRHQGLNNTRLTLR
jgi:hypothetical protein